MICPAVTSVSLFAKAISFPALIASIVGRIPIIPTIAVTRISDSGCLATSSSPSIPLTTLTSRSFILSFNSFALSSFQTAASFGLNSLICFSKRSILFPAASAVTSRSPFVLTISNVCVPMDPVDPKIAIFFIVTFYLYSAFMLQSTKLWISNASITHISPFTETGKDRK